MLKTVPYTAAVYIANHEGTNTLYRQAKNSNFLLLLASNWLKFYCDSSKYPYHELSEVLNTCNYH